MTPPALTRIATEYLASICADNPLPHLTALLTQLDDLADDAWRVLIGDIVTHWCSFHIVPTL
jgi:hypothetical protein